jgi:iron complex outermembrane receptor protein
MKAKHQTQVLSRRTSALLSASVGALALTAPAFAQDEPQGGLDRITVTATRTETNLQDTPLAVTAVTAAALEARAFNSIEEVAAIVPNASFRQAQVAFGRAVTAYVRGIGQNDFNLAFEPGVAMYVDDQYYALLAGSVFDLLDIERVEVLRGPQGTLFGRGAIGGAVNIIPKEPGPNPEAYLDFTYGSYDRTDIRAGFNYPISENLFLRVSGVNKTRKGYQKLLDFRCAMIQAGTPELAGNFPGLDPSGGSANSAGTNDNCVLDRYGGDDIQALRGAIKYEGGSWETTFSADYTNDDSPPVADKQIQIIPSAGTNNLSDLVYEPLWGIRYDQRFLTDSPYTTYATYADPIPAGSQFPAGCDPTPITGNCTYYNGSGDRGGVQLPRKAVIENWGFSNKTNIDLTEDLSFTLITGYRDVFTTGINDTDGSPIGIQTVKTQIEHDQFTIEPRFTYNSDFMDLTVGGFFYTSDAQVTSLVAITFIPLHQNALITFDSTAKAVYGQGVFHPFGPRLGVTGGLRYSEDKKDVHFNNGQGGIDVDLPIRGDSLDWRAGLDFQVTDDVTVYGSAATGYRPGSFNPRPFQGSQLVSVDSEEAIAYELGFKGDLFNDTMRVNLAGFYTDFKQRIIPAGGAECIDSGVSGDCVVPGMQVEVPAGEDGSTCRAYDPMTDGPPNLAAGIGVVCIPKTNYVNTPGTVKGVEAEIEWVPFEGLTINASGGWTNFKAPELATGPFVSDKPVYVPEWTGSAGVAYEIPVPGLNGSITPRMDWFYSGEINYNSLSAIAFTEAYSVFNGRITYVNDDGDFQIAVGATNLFDNQYFLNVFDLTAFGQPSTEGQPAAPREWYIQVKKSF